MNELFLIYYLDTLMNTIWDGLCVCDYGGLTHWWTYIWNGLNVRKHGWVYILGGYIWGEGCIVGGLPVFVFWTIV